MQYRRFDLHAIERDSSRRPARSPARTLYGLRTRAEKCAHLAWQFRRCRREVKDRTVNDDPDSSRSIVRKCC